MANSGYKNICRIEQPEKKLFGWYVRINFQGKSYAKFFNDKFHGKHEDKSLHAAVQYRNQLERELGKPTTERRVVSRHPNNKTGVIGIRRYNKKTGTSKTGKPYFSDVYEVTWCPEPNKVKRTSFSVAKYGEREAYRRAYELRKRQERRMYGDIIQDDPKLFPGIEELKEKETDAAKE